MRFNSLWLCTENGEQRVLRGGSWNNNGSSCRSAYRNHNEPDNRNSHFWLALYWAEALAAQTTDAELADWARSTHAALAGAADTIDAELVAAQGDAVELGGYYAPTEALVRTSMRPSPTLNAIIDSLGR